MSKPPLEYPLLVIDTSSRKTWVGLKRDAKTLFHGSSVEDPSKSLFELVTETLSQTGQTLDTLASIAFCAGPGSMLGARTACMAIRAWKGIGIAAARSLYSYTSLDLGSLIIAATPHGKSEALIVTDARRASWNTLPSPRHTGDQIEIVPNESLESEPRPLFTFAEFPRWTKTKAQLHELAYDPTPVFENERFISILKPESEAAPFILRQSDFKKWVPKIHTAPAQ